MPGLAQTFPCFMGFVSGWLTLVNKGLLILNHRTLFRPHPQKNTSAWDDLQGALCSWGWKHDKHSCKVNIKKKKERTDGWGREVLGTTPYFELWLGGVLCARYESLASCVYILAREARSAACLRCRRVEVQGEGREWGERPVSRREALHTMKCPGGQMHLGKWLALRGGGWTSEVHREASDRRRPPWHRVRKGQPNSRTGKWRRGGQITGGLVLPFMSHCFIPSCVRALSHSMWQMEGNNRCGASYQANRGGPILLLSEFEFEFLHFSAHQHWYRVLTKAITHHRNTLIFFIQRYSVVWTTFLSRFFFFLFFLYKFHCSTTVTALGKLKFANANIAWT